MRTGKYNYGEFLSGKHRFIIPKFQRNYSWDKQHLEDLWSDLDNELEKTHFFGTFLIQQSEGEERRDRVFEVIDGQQRLTSTIILLFEMQRQLDTLNVQESKEEAEDITRNYIFDGDKHKLTLIGKDRDFFKDRIFGGVIDAEGHGQRSSSPTPDDVDTPSCRRLLQAKRFFRDKLTEKLSQMADDEFLDYCVNLLTKVEEMDAMVYQVESRADAVRIFQTVNDRGKQLSDLEKTKSYLMHQLYLLLPNDREALLEEQINRIQRNFGDIYNHIDSINDSSIGASIGEDDVQRYHFIIWNEDWSGNRNERYYHNHLEHLKQTFETEKVDAIDIISYTDELELAFNSLRQIVTQENIDDDRINQLLSRLFTIGRLGNFYPLLIAIWMKYNNGNINEKELVNLLERIETFIVRVYLIQQKAADTGRIKLYKRSRRLHKNGTNNGISHSINYLDMYINEYCDDDSVRNVLQNSNVYSRYEESNRLNELRYILYFFEKTLEDKLEGISLDFEEVVDNPDNKFTIEHIWPKDRSNLSLSATEMEEHEENKHRLGNLALMVRPWNSSESNNPYQAKQSKYRSSKIRMLNRVADEYDKWGTEEITSREDWMIETIIDQWPDNAQPPSLDEWL